MSHFKITRLVSNLPNVAANQDETLVNAWGIYVDKENIWVASNEFGLIKKMSKEGVTLEEVSLFVGTVLDNPTGLIYNKSKGFVISEPEGESIASAEWITVTEGGRIFAYNDLVSESAILVKDEADEGNVYKGLTQLDNKIYLADFSNFKVDVYDSNWDDVELGASAFVDPKLPSGYSPFNVAAIDGKIYVAFALKEADGNDEVDGAGLGIVSVFDGQGKFIKRLISEGGVLNAPWAMVKAPSCFGKFGDRLLVGNFGDGKINVFSFKGKHLGELSDKKGDLVIDGLWGLFASKKKVYYAAGPDGESNGEVGYISVKEKH
jgi:uncharacterized protein (TIGR03118 family)